jgi:ribosomal protein S18 acetylase RimI-like enzyme
VHVDVKPVKEREAARAARLLARAFAADPVIGYYLAEGWRRPLGFRAFFRAALYESLPHGAVYAARDRNGLVGVAAWLPPDAADAPATLRARMSTAAVKALYPATGAKLFAGFGDLAALHPSEPHWYLMFVGVEPRLQSSGIGATLLSPVLEHADLHKVLCYLETPFEGTLSFYRRLSFETRSESQPFEAPTPIWTMTRVPQTSRVT